MMDAQECQSDAAVVEELSPSAVSNDVGNPEQEEERNNAKADDDPGKDTQAPSDVGVMTIEDEATSDVTEPPEEDRHCGRLGIAIMTSPSEEQCEENDTQDAEPPQQRQENPRTRLQIMTLQPVDEDSHGVVCIFEDEDARSVISSSSSSVQPSIAGSVSSRRSTYSNLSTRSRRSLAISMDGALHDSEREEDPVDRMKKRRKAIENFQVAENVVFLDPAVSNTFGNQDKEMTAPKGGQGDEDTLATDGNETYQSISYNKITKNDQEWKRQRRSVLLGLFILISTVVAVVCFVVISHSQATSTVALVQQADSTGSDGGSCLLQRTVQDQQFIEMELYLKGVPEYVNPTQERQLELAMKAAFNQAVGGSDGCADTKYRRWMVRADLAHQAMIRDFVVREQLQENEGNPSSFNTVLADTSILVTRFHTEISCQGCVAEQAFASIYPSFFGPEEDIALASSTSKSPNNETDQSDQNRRMVRRRRRTVEDLRQEVQEQQVDLNAGLVIENIERVMRTILPSLEGFEKVTIVASSEDGASAAVTMHRSGSATNSKGNNGNDREGTSTETSQEQGESAYGFTSGGGHRPSFARNQVFSKVSTILDCATITRPRKKRKKSSKSNKSDKSSKSGKSGKSSKSGKSRKSSKSTNNSYSSRSEESSADTSSHDRSPSTDNVQGDVSHEKPPPSDDSKESGSSDNSQTDSATSMDKEDDTLSFSDESEDKEEGAYDGHDNTDPPTRTPSDNGSTDSTPTTSTDGRLDVPTAAPSVASGSFPLPTESPADVSAGSEEDSVDEVTEQDPESEAGANDVWSRCDPDYKDDDTEADTQLVGRLDNPPCSVCGTDQTVTKFSAIVSSSLSGQGTTTCGLLQLAGKMGHLRADVCAVLPTTIRDVCGCAPPE
jgi:hypothetical protein